MYPEIKYDFSAEELRQGTVFNAVYADRRGRGYRSSIARDAATTAVLHSMISYDDVGISHYALSRAAKDAAENGLPEFVAQMYDEAYADNAAFDAAQATQHSLEVS